MSTAMVHLHNHTSTGVTFGLYCGDNGNEDHKQVNGNGHDTIKINANARIIGVWTADKTFYPNDNNPYTTYAVFKDNGEYTVTLTTSSLTVTHSP